MKQTIPVYINGLFPNLLEEDKSKGSSVIILNPEFTPSDPEFVLLQGSADQNGIYQAIVDTKVIGKKVTLRVRDLGFKSYEVDVFVEEYGIYHTVKLEQDYVYKPAPTSEAWRTWNSNTQYAKALNELARVFEINPMLKTFDRYKRSPEEFKLLLEEKLDSKIKQHIFEDFLKEIQGVELTDFAASSLLGRMLAKNIQAEYATIQYYEFILLQNFTRLTSTIDQHVVYGLSDRFIKFTPFLTFYNIELNANFINYLESFAGLGTCMMALKNEKSEKSFHDQQFNSEYKALINQLPVSNSVLRTIRNKYHHARGFRLTQVEFHSADAQGEVRINRKYVIPLTELLEEVQMKSKENTHGWTKGEWSWLESEALDGYIDIKKLVVEHYKAYASFLNQYNSSLTSLVRRKTGCEIQLTI